MYNLVNNYGISHTDVMDSLWHVVHAVNNLHEFKIEYPSCVDEQKRIAAGFERVSEVGFDIFFQQHLICRLQERSVRF